MSMLVLFMTAVLIVQAIETNVVTDHLVFHVIFIYKYYCGLEKEYRCLTFQNFFGDMTGTFSRTMNCLQWACLMQMI
jgi:hypothetical protein